MSDVRRAMKFGPKTPREGTNVSDVHPLAEAATLILGLSAIFVVIAAVLIFMVELVLMFVSTETEGKLFAAWVPDDLVAVTGEDDRVHETRRLVQRLAKHWPDPPYEFRVEVSKSDIPNALALPGGLIVVTTGLLDRVESENELAFVLGHELGHFRNRDHIRMLGRGVVLSIFFAAITGSESSTGPVLSIADVALRRFSRKQESQADSFGLETVYSEYGHVEDAGRFFKRLADDDSGASGVEVYLSAHPSPGDL